MLFGFETLLVKRRLNHLSVLVLHSEIVLIRTDLHPERIYPAFLRVLIEFDSFCLLGNSSEEGLQCMSLVSAVTSYMIWRVIVCYYTAHDLETVSEIFSLSFVP